MISFHPHGVAVEVSQPESHLIDETDMLTLRAIRQPAGSAIDGVGDAGHWETAA